MTFLRRTLLPAVLVLLVLTLITGVLYPVAILAVGQVAFSSQANGSLIVRDDGTAVGSSLIGHSVLVPGTTATLATGGAIGGAVNAPAGTTSLTVNVQDSTGAVRQMVSSDATSCRACCAASRRSTCRQRAEIMNIVAVSEQHRLSTLPNGSCARMPGRATPSACVIAEPAA